MSSYIGYLSFNAKRADKKWENFPEDIAALRKVYHDAGEERALEINPARRQKRLEIFKSLTEQNYFLPGKKSWEYGGDANEDEYEQRKETYEEGLMEDLLSYAVIYPDGIKTPAGTDQFRKLDPKLAREYEDIPALKEKDIAGKKLNERQNKLNEEVDLSYFLYEDEFDSEVAAECFKAVDLYYGAVGNDLFEDMDIAESVMRQLSDFSLKQEDGVPAGAELVAFYENLNKYVIEKLGNGLADDFGWDDEERKEGPHYVLDIFKAMKPVAKDLKENPDSILISEGEDGSECYPQSANKILEDRAQKHIKDFKGILAPVL